MSAPLGAATHSITAHSVATAEQERANDGTYRASTPYTQCIPNSAGEAAQIAASEYEFTVTGNDVTLIITAEGTTYSPFQGHVDEDGSFNVLDWRGRFRDGRVEGSLHRILPTGQVCDLSFTGERVAGAPAEGEDSNLRIKEIATASGNVYVQRAGAAKGETEILDADSVINVGDTIIVPTAGHGALIGPPGYPDTYMLRPGTRMTIDKPYRVVTVGEMLIKAAKAWVDGFLQEYNQRPGIDTNRVNTSIQGTILVVKATDARTTVKVIEGRVTVTAKKNGKAKIVNAGQSLTVDRRGFGAKKKFDVNAEKAKWEELVP